MKEDQNLYTIINEFSPVADVYNSINTIQTTQILPNHENEVKQPLPQAICFTRADRYGVVFTTLLKNKMLAIRQQTGVSDDKQMPTHDIDSKHTSEKSKRSLTKTLSMCVRQNSLPNINVSELKLSQDNVRESKDIIDIELGKIENETNLIVHSDMTFPNRQMITETPLCRTSAEEALSSFSTCQILDSIQFAALSSGGFDSTPKPLTPVLPPHQTTPCVQSAGIAYSNRNAALDTKFITHKMQQQSDIRTQQRVIEARSISAQVSPVLPRTQFNISPPYASLNITENRIYQPPHQSVQPIVLHTNENDSTFDFVTDSLTRQLTFVNDEKCVNVRLAEADVSNCLVVVPVKSERGSHGFINIFNELTAHGLRRMIKLQAQHPPLRESLSDESDLRPSSSKRRLPGRCTNGQFSRKHKALRNDIGGRTRMHLNENGGDNITRSNEKSYNRKFRKCVY